jgi:hypothetical protein
MSRELSPERVSARLATLRELYVPETLDEARARTAPVRAPESLEQGAARRLAELRALLELTRHLHRGAVVCPST